MNLEQIVEENRVLRQKLARKQMKSDVDHRSRRTIGVRVPRELYDQCAKAARNTHRTMYRFALDAVITELYRCPRNDRTICDKNQSQAARMDLTPDRASDPDPDRGDLRRSAADCGDLPPWEEVRSGGTSKR